jgi:hypothetical protein
MGGSKRDAPGAAGALFQSSIRKVLQYYWEDGGPLRCRLSSVNSCLFKPVARRPSLGSGCWATSRWAWARATGSVTGRSCDPEASNMQ